MRYIVVEGLPAVGKSELLALLARYYPETIRVLPELVKETVRAHDLDLFRDRDRLTSALAAALPDRASRIQRLLDEGFLCLEESHLGVHHAYSVVLGDAGFVAASPTLGAIVPQPEAYVRLELPVERSVDRQRARGTPAFEVDARRLRRMIHELDRWHANRSPPLFRVSADRPAHMVVAELEAYLGLTYGAHPDALVETFDVLLLLGRPASGKSEFIDFMHRSPAAPRAERYHLAPFDVVDDFPILWQTFLDDDIWEQLGRERLHSKRYGDNYAVDDDELWGFLIEKINRRVNPIVARPRALARRTLLVEFSRGGATGYEWALSLLAPAILERAAILYIDVSFEESWRRNLARYDAARRDGILTHSVPREEMERSYGDDDWRRLAPTARGVVTSQGIEVPYVTMVNEPETSDPSALSERYAAALDPLYEDWQARHA